MAQSPLQSIGIARAIGQRMLTLGGVLSELGHKIQGKFGRREALLRTRRVVPFRGTTPVIEKSKFLAPSAIVAGNVTLGQGSSLWYSSVIRADQGPVTVGENTHIQERVVIRSGVGGEPVVLGSNVTVETGVIIEGPCTVEDGAFLCAGCILLPGSQVAKNAVVCAGVVVDGSVAVTPDSIVELGQQDADADAGGVVVVVVRAASTEERSAYTAKATACARLAPEHADVNFTPVESLVEDEFMTLELLRILNDGKRFKYTPSYRPALPIPRAGLAGPLVVDYHSLNYVKHTVK